MEDAQYFDVLLRHDEICNPIVTIQELSDFAVTDWLVALSHARKYQQDLALFKNAGRHAVPAGGLSAAM